MNKIHIITEFKDQNDKNKIKLESIKHSAVKNIGQLNNNQISLINEQFESLNSTSLK